MSVLVIGDVGADLLIALPPRSGISLLHAIQPTIHPGGTVGNTAVALARLGVSVTLVSAVGADAFGGFLVDAFRAAGIATHLATVPERPTMLVFGIIDHDGERYLAMYPAEGMASGYLDPVQVDPAQVRAATWVHASGSSFREGTTADAVIATMAIARQAGIPVSFDVNLRPLEAHLPTTLRDRTMRAVGLADFILGSAADEFTLLADDSDPIRAAQRMTAEGRVAIARTGPRGCIVVRHDAEPIVVPAFPVVVADTLGAGDTFDAGFVTAMLEGRDLVDAARFGNAAAATSLQGDGAALHLTRDDVDRLFQQPPRSVDSPGH